MARRPTKKRRGNCYYTTEAVWHLLGGPKSGWKVMHMRWEGESHWFLEHVTSNYLLTNGLRLPEMILDLTMDQFKKRPNYPLARGKGFRTKKPSAKAQEIMTVLAWQWT